ncbi:MAG: hypothetical protein ACQESP_01010 [Candidatus Muiribacteriota bacterium]
MKNKGSVYILVLLSVAIVYIISVGFIYFTTTARKQETMDRHRIIAKYIAESGIQKAKNTISDIFYDDLFDDETQEINHDKLSLLDPEIASDFIKVIEIDDFIEDGELHIAIELLNLTTNPDLASSVEIKPGEEDNFPDRLNIYKSDESGQSSRKLGGYIAILQITSKGIYRGREYILTSNHSIKVTNIAPIGEEYTLFIRGQNEEHLKYGRFVLSNWTVDMEQVSNLINNIQELSGRAEAQIPSSSVDDFSSMLNYVKNFVLMNRDSEIREEASNLLFDLDFRRWGRVRTNGVLHVFLPFFEVDDIINYFVENQYYSKPEVGYAGCYNRLHNTYLGRYTRFEGNIRKHYWRLAPYVLSRHFPVERNDTYTRFSTDSYYPQENPEEFDPTNYILTQPNEIDRFFHQETSENVQLYGTRNQPIEINGLYNIRGNLNIAGYVKGKGALIVQGDVIIEGNIAYSDNKSLLQIISLNNPITIPPMNENITVDGSIFSEESIRGGQKIKINGNLIVENLNRQQGPDARDTIMPGDVEIIYSSFLRNYYARHIYGGISRKPISLYLNELTPREIDMLRSQEEMLYR